MSNHIFTSGDLEGSVIRQPLPVSAHLTVVYDDGSVQTHAVTAQAGKSLEIEIRNAASPAFRAI